MPRLDIGNIGTTALVRTTEEYSEAATAFSHERLILSVTPSIQERQNNPEETELLSICRKWKREANNYLKLSLGVK